MQKYLNQLSEVSLIYQIVLNQYNQDGLLECLFLNIEITEPQTGLIDSDVKTEGLFAFPNPANEIATLTFSTSIESKVVINITNTLGKIVYKNEIGNLSAGKHIMPISTVALVEGIYFVNLMTDNKIITKQITIVK